MSFISIILFWILTLSVLESALQKAPNFQANMLILYNNSYTSMPNQQFYRLFANTFQQTPILAYGINNYQVGDQFYYQNFYSEESGVTNNAFRINVVSTLGTHVRLFSISYIATTLSYFSSKSHIYYYPYNITSGSGDRYLHLFYSKTFSSTHVFALPLLTAYFITSTTYFKLTTTAAVVSNSTYQLQIFTTSDCSIRMVRLFILFCQIDQLISNGYYYKGGQEIIYSNDDKKISFTTQISHYRQSEFILGLRGFDGQTVLSGCYWGWSISSIDSSTATLLIGKKQLQNIYFSFLQIGIYTQDPESKSWVGLIVGLIVSAVVLGVLIVVLWKCIRRKNYEAPKKEIFKEMPTFTL